MVFKTPILIFCRIKPASSDDLLNDVQKYSIKSGEGLEKDTLIVFNYQNINFVNHKPDSHIFQFVKVFDQDASQDQIYDAVAKPVVQSALKGYNGTIFAYGQTGSGKTHTISGVWGNPGIVSRALHDIFAAIEKAEGEIYDVQMSYLEIYNEHSNDLLMSAGEEKKKISLRENGEKVLEWHNLSLFPVQTYSEAMELLTIGDNNRIVGDTPMNVYSSRSHTILTVYLTARIQDSLEVRRAKLNLVDLAGSERVHKTGEEGIILEEARYINLSLHYLEQVIVALSDPARSHVPYRNCTLTAALRDSLGGNCMTVMVANIAMDKENIEETVSTCRFAQRVSLVRNELTVNTEQDLSGENAKLKAEIQQLKGQCYTLRNRITELEQKCSIEDVLPSQENSLRTQSSNYHHLNSQQLKTDIVYMIDWLQDLKSTNSGQTGNNVSELSSFSVFRTEEPSEGFDDFVTTIKAKEDWFKAKEIEEVSAKALANKLDAINSVHQDILTWWKQNEKSLVREMLSGRVINIPGNETTVPSIAVPPPSSPPFGGGNACVDSLLQTHSELLKDFQLLKSRLQSSKRNLQRLKRKYLVEFTNWKKAKISLDNMFEKLNGSGDFEDFESIKTTGLAGNDSLSHFLNDVEVSSNEKLNNKHHHSDRSVNYTNKFNWNNEELRSDQSLLLNESDLSSVFGELNNSVFSTSTLLSDFRINLTSEPRGCKEPRLVRSVPTALHTSSGHLRLTGDPSIDEEIINFYQNKSLN